MKTTRYIIIVPPLWLAAIKRKLLTALSLVLLTAGALCGVAGVNGLMPLGVGLAGFVACSFISVLIIGRIE